MLDFDDLLVKARDLLCDPNHPEVRRRLAASIERLLVDECQDTDPLQKELIDALVGDDETRRKLFLVGDFKQSIYRFRRADPQIFTDWHGVTHETGRLPLAMNFRSQPEILAFVNLLFRDYFGAAELLRAKRDQLTPTPAIEFLWATPGGEPADDGDDSEAVVAANDFDARAVAPLRRAEAEWIARRIRGIVDSRTPLIPEKNAAGETVLRPAEFGDVAILFRALSDADLYEKALDRHGMPYYVVGGKAFYGQQEVYDLLNFLRAVESNCDDVALAGVLRSPFFSLRDDTLFLLAQHAGGLAGGLFAKPLTDDLAGDERRRAEFAAAVITRLASREEPPADRRLAERNPAAHGVRRDSHRRFSRRAKTGQPSQAGRDGPAVRWLGCLHAQRVHSPADRRGIATARRSPGRGSRGEVARRAIDDDPPIEGSGVSDRDRARSRNGVRTTPAARRRTIRRSARWSDRPTSTVRRAWSCSASWNDAKTTKRASACSMSPSRGPTTC